MKNKINKKPLKNLKVLAHRQDLTASSQSEHGLTFNVKKIIVNPKYNSESHSQDTAIWLLSGKNQGLNQYPNLDLTGNITQPGDIVFISGWGTTSSGGDLSDILLKAELPIVSNEECSKDYGETISNDQLCAAYPQGGTDTCQGDSGGPLFVVVNDTPVLVGATSWGQGCALPGKPGVYARISSNAEW